MGAARLERQHRRGHSVAWASQAGAGSRRVAQIHGQRQLANGPFEAATLAQHHGLLGQHGGRVRKHKFGSQCLPGCVLHKLHRGRAVAARCRVLAQVAQHSPGFNRGQLVFVAQQHQARRRRQGQQQRVHHFQVHHRGLVHDQHIHIERVGRVVAKLACVGPCPQQRMQRARRAHAGNQRAQVQTCIGRHGQAGQGIVDRLLQARRRLASGRSQRHAQRAAIGVQRQQQRQQAGGGVGLAGAGPTRDDRQPRAQRHGAGHFLPVGEVVRLGGGFFGVWHKETVQPFACRRFGHGQGLAGALQQALAHALLIARITAQVQKRRIGRSAQHHRLALVGGVGQTHNHAGPVALQSCLPIGQRAGQVRPQGLQALRTVHRRRRPGQQGHGWLGQIGHGQAGVATPFHVCEHGRSHQQGRRCLGIEAQHLRGKSAVDVAQQALTGPQVQPLHSLYSGQALSRQVHEPVHLCGGHGRHA